MTTSGRIENPGITVAPCRLPSPKTTAPWARRPQTSWPSTTPGAPPGPCSRRAEAEALPPFWGDIAELGWLGLHLPEELGGSGFGLPELVVVVEELGRAVTPGPFVPTVIASAVIDSVGGDELKRRLLPGLADGSVLAGVGLTSDISVSGGKAAGSAPAVLGGGLAQILVLPAGDDAIVVDVAAGGVTVETPLNLDPTRRSARVTLDGASAESCPVGGGRSSTWPGSSWRPRRWASPRSAPSRRPPTPRCACSSAGPSPCSRPSSTTAPTCWWRRNWPRPTCGTPPGRPRREATS